jgi:predicted helicase
MVFFVNEYNRELERWNEYKILHHYQDIKKEANPVVDKFLQERNLIKWSKMIKRDKFRKGKKAELNVTDIRKSSYRPFISVYLYFGYIPIDLRGQQEDIFPNNINNIVIAVNVSTKSFNILCSQYIVDLHFNGDSVCLPICRYDKKGNSTDNITDWGLNQFRTHYQNDSITKEDIFHYTYAVLHHPAYREKYALNLKREFPRLPFYEDFPQWVTWGKQLMDLHLNYETVKKYALKRIDKKLASNKANKPKLKADKEAGNIQLDDITTLQGIPFEAWEYKLGNRSALEWILDQYKEKKPRDQTIAEKFNTYRFADYKESVIELLQRVCTVSVETMAIIGEMP